MICRRPSWARVTRGGSGGGGSWAGRRWRGRIPALARIRIRAQRRGRRRHRWAQPIGWKSRQPHRDDPSHRKPPPSIRRAAHHGHAPSPPAIAPGPGPARPACAARAGRWAERRCASAWWRPKAPPAPGRRACGCGAAGRPARRCARPPDAAFGWRRVRADPSPRPPRRPVRVRAGLPPWRAAPPPAVLPRHRAAGRAAGRPGPGRGRKGRSAPSPTAPARPAAPCSRR